jgi:hypothetical protein
MASIRQQFFDAVGQNIQREGLGEHVHPGCQMTISNGGFYRHIMDDNQIIR